MKRGQTLNNCYPEKKMLMVLSGRVVTTRRGAGLRGEVVENCSKVSSDF